MPEPLRVALVDDHDFLLQGVIAALARTDDIVVAAAVSTMASSQQRWLASSRR